MYFNWISAWPLFYTQMPFKKNEKIMKIINFEKGKRENSQRITNYT